MQRLREAAKIMQHFTSAFFMAFMLAGCVQHKKIIPSPATLGDFSLKSVPAGYNATAIERIRDTERITFMAQAYPSKTPTSMFALQIDRSAPTVADAAMMNLGHIVVASMVCDRAGSAALGLPSEANASAYNCILQTAQFPANIPINPQLKLVIFRHAHETDYVTGNLLPQKRSDPALPFSSAFDEATFDALVQAMAAHSATLGRRHVR